MAKLKSITVHYEARDLFGSSMPMTSERASCIYPEHIDTAVEKVVRDGKRLGYNFTVAHFVFQERDQYGTREVTVRQTDANGNWADERKETTAKLKKFLKSCLADD